MPENAKHSSSEQHVNEQTRVNYEKTLFYYKNSKLKNAIIGNIMSAAFRCGFCLNCSPLYYKMPPNFQKQDGRIYLCHQIVLIAHVIKKHY